MLFSDSPDNGTVLAVNTCTSLPFTWLHGLVPHHCLQLFRILGSAGGLPACFIRTCERKRDGHLTWALYYLIHRHCLLPVAYGSVAFYSRGRSALLRIRTVLHSPLPATFPPCQRRNAIACAACLLAFCLAIEDDGAPGQQCVIKRW